MKIKKLTIQNFRGISKAEILLDGNTLFVGTNNIGKSTICEALDLTIGPDRLSRFDPIDEYDFYNGLYLSKENVPIEIVIEVILIDLSASQETQFASYLNFWNSKTNQILDKDEIDGVDSDDVVKCLHLRFVGKYSEDEDEFEAVTYFVNSLQTDGSLKSVTKAHKRTIGFLYLRALRTGRRALSLEKGTLLDLILRTSAIQLKFWEDTRNTLMNLEPPLDEQIGELRKVLDDLERRIGTYIPLNKNTKNTSLQVSQLTRAHLRKTLSFFMASFSGTAQIPFDRLGTGTLSTLVFSMLSSIADLKNEQVIFAMEEPEIAIPPHTQRRIIQYLLGSTSQALITSHSPYVIEMFGAEEVVILKKNNLSLVEAKKVELKPNLLKAKTYRKKIRHSIAEALLSRGVIVGEGITEKETLIAASKILENNNPDYYPLDLSGITVLDSEGEGNLSRYANFFKSLELPVYGFFDNQNLNAKERKDIDKAFNFYEELKVKKIETMLIDEIPIDVQWKYLNDLKNSGIVTNPVIPDIKPADVEIKKLTNNVLVQAKGDKRAATLIEYCLPNELPTTITTFLKKVYDEHPKPEINIDAEVSEDEQGINDEE